MGGIDEVSATIGELRSDVRNLSDQVKRLAGAIELLQQAEGARGGFNKAMAIVSGVIGGIASPVFGWLLGFIHIGK